MADDRWFELMGRLEALGYGDNLRMDADAGARAASEALYDLLKKRDIELYWPYCQAHYDHLTAALCKCLVKVDGRRLTHRHPLNVEPF